MYRRCCLKGCENGGAPSGPIDYDVHFYSLPKDPEIRQRWCEWIASENKCNALNSRALLCSLHFRPEDVGKKKLKMNSVPCLPVIVKTVECVSTQVKVKGDAVKANTLFDTGSAESCSRYVVLNQREHEPQTLAMDCGTSVQVDLCSSDCYFDYVDPACETNLHTETVSTESYFDPIVLEERKCEFDTINIKLEAASKTEVCKTKDSENHTLSSQRTFKKCFKKECAAVGCKTTWYKSYYTFPGVLKSDQRNVNNIERCKLWIKNSGNLELLKVPSSSLHGNYYICSDHLDDEQFYNHHRKTLLPKAVPTVFSCDPLCDNWLKTFPILEIQDVERTLVVSDSDISGMVQNKSCFVNNNQQDLHSVDEPVHNNQREFQSGDEPVSEVTGVEVSPTQNTSIMENEEKFDNLQLKFENDMVSMEWRICPNCKEKFSVKANCNITCLHSRNNCALFTEMNNMDPGDVPDEFQGLSYIEELLIAKTHALISVFKLKGHQYGYSGNIINFPQNVKSFAKKLPHRIENLSSVITIRTLNAAKPVDFVVRAGVVRSALQWLTMNNPWYFDVEVSEENMSTLPENENVYDQMNCVTMHDHVENEEEFNDDVDDCVIHESGVPMIGKPSQEKQIQTVLGWPEIGKDAINEFHTAGYIVQAFPVLFPTGKADLRAVREKQVTPAKYFQHLMRYHDERFAKHPRFRYFALNSVMH